MKKYVRCNFMQAKQRIYQDFLCKVRDGGMNKDAVGRLRYTPQYSDAYVPWSPQEVWLINVDENPPQSPSIESKSEHEPNN